MERSHKNPVMLAIGEAVMERLDDYATLVARVSRELPGYDQMPEEARRDSAAALGAIAIKVALIEQRAVTEAELDLLEAVVRERLHAGIPADSVSRAIYLALPTLWEIAGEVAAARGESITLLTSAPVLFEIVHQCLDRVAAVATDVAAQQFEARRQDRARFLHDALIDGDVNDADRHGLSQSVSYAAFRARAAEPASVPALERAIHDAARAIGDMAVTGIVAGDLAGIVTKMPSFPDTTATVGVGPTVPLGELRSSFRLATRALETASVFGRVGTFTLNDFGVCAAVAADDTIGEMLDNRYVAPLDRAGTAFADAVITTLGAYLRNQLRVDPTARALGIHPNTLRYRLGRYEQLTGADLSNIDQLVGIWWALERRQSMRPARPIEHGGTSRRN